MCHTGRCCLYLVILLAKFSLPLGNKIHPSCLQWWDSQIVSREETVLFSKWSQGWAVMGNSDKMATGMTWQVVHVSGIQLNSLLPKTSPLACIEAFLWVRVEVSTLTQSFHGLLADQGVPIRSHCDRGGREVFPPVHWPLKALSWFRVCGGRQGILCFIPVCVIDSVLCLRSLGFPDLRDC
jgi:hypothetical protein